MKIFPVKDSSSPSSVYFKRKPSAAALKYYAESVNEGLNVLDKNVGIIIHNSSLPSSIGKNVGIGSLLTMATTATFAPFIRSHGIDSIQQDPIYHRKLSDPSPYSPISTSKNIYMIPLDNLVTDEYDNILDKSIFDSIVERKNADNEPNRVNYEVVPKEFDFALRSAFKKFNSKKVNGEIKPTLLAEYDNFKQEKQAELEPNAIYEIISKKFNTNSWKNWPNEYQELYDKEENKNLLTQIKSDNKDEIDFHIFKQWLVEREIEKANEKNKKLGIKVIADTPVAFTPAEEWLHKDLFIQDLAMGCPPDFFSKEGHRWGFPVLNLKKLFKEDGSFDKAGLFLKKRYEDIFKSSPGGVRIDHLIGILDPFVYARKEPHINWYNSGRLCSSPHVGLLKDYVRTTEEEYLSIFQKIIFPAARKYDVPKSNIICEDLGEITPPVRNVIDKLNLTGISISQYGYTGVDSPEKNVYMLGSHDNKSFIEYTNELFENANNSQDGRNHFNYKTHVLAADTNIPNKDENKYRDYIRSDKKAFMRASFAELFTARAKKVQIFFTDFFGIGKTYNVPGLKKDCWTLRLPSDYEDLYYDNVSKGLGMNIPELIAIAIRRRGQEFAEEHKILLRKLDFFTKILKGS